MRKNPSFLIRLLASLLAVCVVSAPTLAQVPEPNTYTDVPVPLLSRWLNTNAQTVDPEHQDGVTHIYPDQATRDADIAGDGTGRVAIIHWSLDDGSGRAPGIQTVNDDFLFPTQNCIMASGERLFESVLVPKSCSDPAGSSKRIFLEIEEVNTPIDLVFELGVGDIRYKGVQDPALVGDDQALSEFRNTYGIGRIYRVIQKFINLTDERLVSVRVEVGTGVGDAFVPLSFDEYGVAFELREFVPREFFVGETGAGDREVWDEDRFAHFSPKMFDDGLRPRFDPGFLSHESAGLFPPQLFQTSVAAGTKTQFIESGSNVNALGYYGALTPNYFDLPANQGSGAGILGTVFGYMLPDSDVPTVIERHDDGDPNTEGDAIEAWWDGVTWRYGEDDSFAEVALSELQQWAAQPLGLDIPGGVDPTRYEALLSDDLSGMNMDTYLYLGDALLEAGTTPHFNDGPPRLDSITLRYTAVPASSLGAVPGTEAPEWTVMGQEAPPLASYMPATGVPVAINDSAATGRDEAVNVAVMSNDLLDGAPIVDGPMVSVGLSVDAANGAAVVEADKTITYTPGLDYVGEDTFTYTVTVDGEESNVATVTVDVVAPPDPDVPVARNDSANPTGLEAMVIDILANDTVGQLEMPVDPTTSTVTIGEEPTEGTVVLNADNTVTYQADEESTVSIVDYFTYTVTVDGAESNSALVIVRVDPLYDVDPVSDGDGCNCTTVGAHSTNSAAPWLLLGLLGLAYTGRRVRRRVRH